MVAFELIPAIDIRGGRCVRLRQGDYGQETVFADDPAEMARRWEQQGATRLHLVDLDGARAGKPVNTDAISAIVAAVTIPCQLGGGFRDEASIRRALDGFGVARVIVGTQALKQPEWFCEMAGLLPERLILGIDARDSLVATAGWLEVSQVRAYDLAAQFAKLPLAALIYTNIANDGMLQGIDRGTLGDLASLADLGLPIIASGGVTSLADIVGLLELHRRRPGVVGAIVGRALYEGTLDLAAALRIVAQA
ncbi:MAG: 1-(5-phosphoribosyl)-5-[(5-phosphoribosylamino)methylideneamino]imidazole-4-carboxamide isomerase [Planctomycetaceae bacterium]